MVGFGRVGCKSGTGGVVCTLGTGGMGSTLGTGGVGSTLGTGGMVLAKDGGEMTAGMMVVDGGMAAGMMLVVGVVAWAGNFKDRLKISAIVAIAFFSSFPICSDNAGDGAGGDFSSAMMSSAHCRRWSSVFNSGIGIFWGMKVTVSQSRVARVRGK